MIAATTTAGTSSGIAIIIALALPSSSAKSNRGTSKAAPVRGRFAFWSGRVKAGALRTRGRGIAWNGHMRRSKQSGYSITSLARSRKTSGIVRPSALAVFRLTTKSNLVGSVTGRSDGHAGGRLRVVDT